MLNRLEEYMIREYPETNWYGIRESELRGILDLLEKDMELRFPEEIKVEQEEIIEELREYIKKQNI